MGLDAGEVGEGYGKGGDVMRWPWQKKEGVVPYKWVEKLLREYETEFQKVRFVELGDQYAAGRAMELASFIGSLKGTLLRAKDEGLA